MYTVRNAHFYEIHFFFLAMCKLIGMSNHERVALSVEFLLKTDSGYPKDTGVTLFTLATPGNPLCCSTHHLYSVRHTRFFCFFVPQNAL